MQTAPVRFDPSRSHSGVSRVEVWSRGELVSGDAPILGGEVTEMGVRYPLVTVPVVGTYGGVVVVVQVAVAGDRVYTGLSWVRVISCPMGRYPVLPIRQPAGEAVTLTADDHWSSVISGTFVYPILAAGTSLAGEIRNLAGLLIQQVQSAEQHFAPGGGHG